MRTEFDPTKDSKFIWYLDANNLYGLAMSKQLPTSGMSFLDLSKCFQYNFIKPNMGIRQKLLFTETDSLAYEIKTKDFYKDIIPDIEKLFDISEYPTNHPSGSKTGFNSKVLDMFKNEAGGKQIVEFIGLRAKLYSYKMLGGLKIKNVRG